MAEKPLYCDAAKFELQPLFLLLKDVAIIHATDAKSRNFREIST